MRDFRKRRGIIERAGHSLLSSCEAGSLSSRKVFCLQTVLFKERGLARYHLELCVDPDRPKIMCVVPGKGSPDVHRGMTNHCFALSNVGAGPGPAPT